MRCGAQLARFWLRWRSFPELTPTISVSTGVQIGPYCELFFHPVCTWTLWNLLLSCFVYERKRLNLINPRVLKIERTFCTWRCWTLPLLRFHREGMQLGYEFILLKKILRSHLLSENMQWNYASFNVTLNYLTHEIMEFCVTSFLARNLEQIHCQTLGNKPNHSSHRVLRGRLFSKRKS